MTTGPIPCPSSPPGPPRCFKYLCLAWNLTEVQVPDTGHDGISTGACYDNWDCAKGMVCLEHHNKAIVDKGFCIDEATDELKECVVAEDCAAGLVCLPPGACGTQGVLDRLHQIPCQVQATAPGRGMKI